MKTVTVKRSNWRRGGSLIDFLVKYGRIRLLNDMGNKCCLGFASQQIGDLKDGDLLNRTYPSSLGIVVKDLSEIVNGDVENTEFSKEAVKINDSSIITDAEREAKLKELTIKHKCDFQFEFVD